MKPIEKVGASLLALGAGMFVTGELIGVFTDGPTATGVLTASAPGLVLALVGVGVLAWHLLDDFFGG